MVLNLSKKVNIVIILINPLKVVREPARVSTPASSTFPTATAATSYSHSLVTYDNEQY